MAIRTPSSIEPCFQDVVSFTLNHDNYDSQKPILIDARDDARFVSLGHARSCVKKLIAGLSLHGVRPRDTVCLHMMNSIMYPLLSLAVIGLGGRVTASNPCYTTAELHHHLVISRTKFMITESAFVGVANAAAADAGIRPCDIFVQLDHEELNSTMHLSTTHLMTFGKQNWHTFDHDTQSEVSIASLATTSGTEGGPKMAARSHLSLVAEAIAIKDTVRDYGIRRLLTIPFFHAFAAPMVLINALYHGHTTYVMKKYECVPYLAAVERYSITETAMPPPLIIRSIALPAEDRKALKTIRRVFCGGATLPADIQERALSMFAPGARIQQCWGMTEAGCIANFHSEDDHTGSVGRLIAGEAKILTESGGTTILPDVSGELLIRSPMTMLGYVGDPAASNAMFDEEGYMRTGDVGHFSADGKIYIDGRKKDLIKVRGFQVSPHELENVLLSYPGIIDCAVIGMQLSDGSEVPMAYVVSSTPNDADWKPGSDMDTKIKAHLRTRLCGYKVSECRFQRVNTIPKSNTGKILRRELRRGMSDSLMTKS